MRCIAGCASGMREHQVGDRGCGVSATVTSLAQELVGMRMAFRPMLSAESVAAWERRLATEDRSRAETARAAWDAYDQRWGHYDALIQYGPRP